MDDFFAASAASISSNLVTHPFETIKVRQVIYGKPIIYTVKHLIQTEGVKALYKGYKVSEVGIFYYPTNFRSGSSVSLKNILLSYLAFDTLLNQNLEQGDAIHVQQLLSSAHKRNHSF